MASIATRFVPEWLTALAALGWLVCVLGVMRLAVRQGGWPRALVELTLTAVIFLLVVAAVTSARSIRQDETLRTSAVAAFEAASHHERVEVTNFRRFDSCAVVSVSWPPDGSAFLGLFRYEGRWSLKGVIAGYADEDDIYDEADCKDAVTTVRTR